MATGTNTADIGRDNTVLKMKYEEERGINRKQAAMKTEKREKEIYEGMI